MNEIIAKRLWIIIIVCVLGAAFYGIKNVKPYETKYDKEITAAKSLLTDAYSQKIFDELIAFNIEKTPMVEADIDAFPENACPEVPVKEGDTIINAGISNDISMTFQLAEAAGPKGEVIGFDPNVRIMEKINEEIKNSNFKNIKTYSYGLWNKNCHKDLFFNDDSDASLVYRKEEGFYLPATLVKLDDFVVKEGVKKVDYISLDVEGAELQALKGAETILLSQKPNLAISIHHRNTDAFEIINYINNLNCGYKFWLGYHSPYSKTQTNVIMYATAK